MVMASNGVSHYFIPVTVRGGTYGSKIEIFVEEASMGASKTVTVYPYLGVGNRDDAEAFEIRILTWVKNQ